MKLKNTILLVTTLSSIAFTVQVSAQEVQDTQMGSFMKEDGIATQAQEIQLSPKLDASNGNLPRKDAVDISDYQKWMNQSDFNQLKAQGVKTVVIKLTEGSNYTNPSAKNQIAMAKAAGLNIAVYHFATLGAYNISTATAKTNAATEARYFASKAKEYGLPSNTVMIFDAEPKKSDNGKYPAFDWTQAAQVFTNELNAAGFTAVRYYTPAAWAKDGAQMEPSKLGGAKNFWIPGYPTSPDKNSLQYTNFGAWQYTDNMQFNSMSTSSGVDASIEYQGNFFAAPLNYVSIYRMYNKNTGEHFYTVSSFERDSLVKSGWTYEGVGWNAPTSGTPVYRIYNPNAKGGDHYYTTSKWEVEQTVKAGWKWDNNGQPAFYAGGNTNVYVEFNPNATAGGSHNYTVNKYEHENLLKNGWTYGAVAWKAK